MSVICPNCNQVEPEGALFCPECGSKMITEDGLYTTKIMPVESNRDLSSPTGQSASLNFSEVPEIETLISLHIVQTGQILPLVGRDEFTIGRISEGQSILPDIDLTPYEAYAQGVSRLHATIKIIKNRVNITDLGSSNGTMISEDKLTPHIEYTLNHGDQIILGRLRIQALIRQDQKNRA